MGNIQMFIKCLIVYLVPENFHTVQNEILYYVCEYINVIVCLISFFTSHQQSFSYKFKGQVFLG